ncbi:hypothetical protein ACIGW8_36795 [Streptomyces sioyaensis]|uniref:hypothetical protein n=1 Tax=Streptomyces sioyaensis TaxID=67364 RepID=UPI0037D3A4CE
MDDSPAGQRAYRHTKQAIAPQEARDVLEERLALKGSAAVSLLRDGQQRLSHQLPAVRSGRLPDVTAEHHRLLEHLIARDAGGFQALLAQHVARHQGAL